MNIAYFKDTDSLYIELLPEDASHAWEAHPGVVLNLSEDGRVIGIELERASQLADLRALRVGNFPGEVVAVDGSTH
ncbi:MAG: DUF2283 domain-containing protein [Thiobacillaceae bacterium]|nr:DUF2283 domain-containing protein [Thiobacillaceae bacterium]MCX7673249.1 DUF2283 domain-containing protein [Thiobacillaceae bacterium]MDW8323984.1 DUF2283 domain-containing protein [Burkholderiales bacterium]